MNFLVTSVGAGEQQFKQAVFAKLRVQIESRLGPELAFVRNHAEPYLYVDEISRDLTIGLKSFVLGQEAERIDVEEKFPEDWWQAFRERWLPARWLKRWPVRYKKISIHKIIYRVCPHMDLKSQDDDSSVCIAYLMG